MGPQNAVVGNDSYGTDIPQTQVDNNAFDEIVKTAKFSKTDEYKQLKEHFEKRIGFYQQYLPDGSPILGEKDMTKLGELWVAANVVIGEFKAVMDVYEGAAQQVKDAASNRKAA